MLVQTFRFSTQCLVYGQLSDRGNSRQSIPKVTMVTSPVEFPHGTMGPWDHGINTPPKASMEQGLRQTKKLGKGWERLNGCVMMCLPILVGNLLITWSPNDGRD
jgi:hypothetical protein